VKGLLTISQTTGRRWDLALSLIESGESGVLLGTDIEIRRQIGWPEADDKVHIAVVTGQAVPDPAAAQRQVARARNAIHRLLSKDDRLSEICRRYGVVWEYLGDTGMGTVHLAAISEEGQIVWPSGDT
jgi:hypothetical protein